MVEYFDKRITFLDNKPNIAMVQNFVCTKDIRLDLIRDTIPKYAEIFDKGPLKVNWYINLNQEKWVDEIYDIYKSSIKEENLNFYNNLEKDWGLVTYSMIKDLKEPYLMYVSEDFPCFTMQEDKDKYVKWLEGQHFWSGQKDFGMNLKDWNDFVSDAILDRELDYINLTKINKIGKVTTTEPAIKYCLGVSAPTFKNCIALESVNELGLSKNISENKNSFQAIINTYNATEAIAGKLKGKMILTIIPNQFCPSIMPASSSSFGILLKYP